jgi:mevalonate kinase
MKEPGKSKITPEEKEKLTRYYLAALDMGKSTQDLLEELENKYYKDKRTIQRYISEFRPTMTVQHGDRVDTWPMMNSQSIYSRHPDIYRTFFSSCECVVSCPGTFFWTGEYSVLNGGISLCQHVPLRVYCGIEPIQDQNVSGPIFLGNNRTDHLVYDVNKFDFRTDLFLQNSESILARLIVSNLQEIFRDLSSLVKNLVNNRKSLRIHTLHELSPGTGANWSGAFSTALIGALLLYENKLNETDLTMWKDKPVNENISDALFKQLCLAAWKVETAFHEGKASGYGAFTSLIASHDPIFYATVKRSNEDPKHPVDIGGDYTILDNIHYGGFRFIETYPKLKYSIDATYNKFNFGLISSGVNKDIGKSMLKTSNELGERLNIARTTVLALVNEKGLSNILENSYFTDFLSEKNTGNKLRWSYIESLSIKGIEVYQSLLELFTNNVGANFENLRALASALNGTKSNIDALGLFQYEVDAVVYHLHRAFRKYDIPVDLVGAKTTGAAQGGSLLFITPSGTNALEALTDGLKNLRMEIKNVSLDWLHTRDGLENDGMRIEKPTKQNDRFNF